MSNVALQIAGRRYTIACAPGEENHVKMLGRSIDERLATLPGKGSQSEARTLLFGALLLADELHEAQAKLDGTAEAFEKLAGRLEDLAERLESGAEST